MKLAVMQPYFFPYLGYFQLLAAADKFILYDNLNYIKGGWIHRNRFLLKGREVISATVPVTGVSSLALIREVRLDPQARWPGKFLDFVAANYRRAPFFAETYPVLEAALRLPATRLTEVNCQTLREVAQHLGLTTTLTHDTAPYEAFETAVRGDEAPAFLDELRAHWSDPDLDLKTLRVLYICEQEGAATYLNAIGGQALYDREQFARHQVNLRFVRPHLPPYDQFGGPFAPGLSIIDVLMHCGQEQTQRMVREYELI